MLTDFSTEYFQRSDDELLRLSSERDTLTAEAATALDAELRRRNLTDSDRVEHQKFIKRQRRREWTHRRRKIWGIFQGRLAWRDMLGAFAVMGLIFFTYFSLPSRYHLKPDWEQAAVMVMISSTVIIFSTGAWPRIAFWMSLAISSAIHLFAVHAITRRIPDLSRGAAKGATVLGLVIFVLVYATVRFLRRNLYGDEAAGA
jgi:hypothetical protein